jgi:hypothetical protein
MHDPFDDEPAVPFPTSPVSNGEWTPRPITRRQRLANELITKAITAGAKRHGMTRKQFLRTAAATATAFAVLNKIDGGDSWGDNAILPLQPEQCDDLDAAKALFDKEVFVMDVQTHHIDLNGPAARAQCFLRFNFWMQQMAALGHKVSMSDLECPEVIGQMNFIKEMFVDSETTVAVLSGLPFSGLSIGPRRMAETRDLVNQLAGSERALSQAMIEPKAAPDSVTGINSFERQVNEFGARGLKVYTYAGNWRLDDEAVSYPMLTEAQRLGIKIVNCHKGLPATFAPGSEETVRTTDFPKVVRDWPKLKFCAYHSGYFQGDHPDG